MNMIKRIALVAVMILVLALAVSCGHKHNLTKVDKLDATCTEAGTEAYYTCDGCDKIFADANGETELDAPKAIAALGHKIIGLAGTEATCTEAGAKDCFKCTACNSLFSDAAGTNKIESAEAVEPLGHNFVKTEAKEATCTENGNNAYWYCPVCKKVYSDAEGNNETTIADQVILAGGHDLTKTEANEATCTAAGNIAYWSCGDCGNVYSDAEGKNKIEVNDVIVSAKGHNYGTSLVIEGAVTTYEPGESFNTANLAVKLVCSACDHTETVTNYTISKSDALTAEDTEIVISYVDGDKTYTATVKITVKHEHTTGDQVAAVAPTCTDKGSVAYYECIVCHEKFEDKAATKPLSSIEISANGHSGIKTDAVDSSCTVQGNNAYWTCGDCGKVFSDEACTVETTVEAEKLPVAGHDTEVKYDSEGHWNDCKNCDYATDKVAHEGFAYPGEIPTCDVCSATTGDAAGWDGWVEFRPGIANISGDAISSASHVDVDGIKASQYVFNAASAGTESASWTNSDKSYYNAGKYQVRIPTVSGSERAIYLFVKNTGDTAISFRMYSENWGDKGGVDITLAAGESGAYKYTVATGNTIGSNVNFKLLSDLASSTTVAVYGYFYLEDAEVANLGVANQGDLKLSYEAGEIFDISNLILSANIANGDEYLNDGGNIETYYIASNYTISGLTSGQTLDTAGTYPVTIFFGGQSVTLNVTVSSHAHEIEAVAYKAATCTEDGNTAYYVCSINGCGQMFADAEGKTPITADSVVIAKGHVAVQLPGTAEYCTRCGATLGDEVMSGENWVLFRPEISVGSGSFAGWSAAYTDVDGVYGSMLTFGAGVNAGDKISLTSWNEQGTFQTIIPNGLDANTANRTVIMYYHNYGTEPITLKYQNDSNSSIYDEVTIPAGGVVVSTFEHPKSGGGSNWFYLQVQNDIQSDVTVGIYGYFYLANEFDSISSVKNAEKLSFATGETFTAEGLMLKTSGGIKTTYIETGYTTNLDGYVFTADDIGTKTVTVTFGGKTITYDIEVTAHKHSLELVAGKAPVACTEDGIEDYYKCTIEGCDEIFADEAGNNKLSAPVAISCHTATATLPGKTIVCADCNQGYAVYQNDALVQFTPGKPGISESPYYEGISGTVDGTSNISHSYVTLDSGITVVDYLVKAGTPENASITLWCNNGNKIPVQSGGTKALISVTNNGANDITISFGAVDGGNDMGSGTITVAAGETVALEFYVMNGASNGNNIWFAVRNAVEEDTHVYIYGYYEKV